MTEKHAAGFKEFLFAFLWAVGILLCYDLSDTAIRLYKNGSGHNMLLTIALVLAFCVLVYFIIKHYASSFIYEVSKSGVKLTRKTGHRTRDIEIKNKSISAFSTVRPENAKKIHSMKKTVFSLKHTYYITYINGGVAEAAAIEPSEEMAEAILRKIKEG